MTLGGFPRLPSVERLLKCGAAYGRLVTHLVVSFLGKAEIRGAPRPPAPCRSFRLHGTEAFAVFQIFRLIIPEMFYK